MASEELYAEEKEQLLSRKSAAIGELDVLQAREQELHEQIRAHEERLAESRTGFEALSRLSGSHLHSSLPMIRLYTL